MAIRFTKLDFAGAPVNGVSEIQRITITGAPTGGSFTITWNGQTTTAIAYNATAAVVQTALEALSNIDPGDVICADGPLPGTPVNVTFAGQYAGLNVAAMTTTDSFTGGATPASAITTPTGGVRGTYRGVEPNCYLVDTVNGIIYQNTGTAKVPSWASL